MRNHHIRKLLRRFGELLKSWFDIFQIVLYGVVERDLADYGVLEDAPREAHVGIGLDEDGDVGEVADYFAGEDVQAGHED